MHLNLELHRQPSRTWRERGLRDDHCPLGCHGSLGGHCPQGAIVHRGHCPQGAIVDLGLSFAWAMLKKFINGVNN